MASFAAVMNCAKEERTRLNIYKYIYLGIAQTALRITHTGKLIQPLGQKTIFCDSGLLGGKLLFLIPDTVTCIDVLLLKETRERERERELMLKLIKVIFNKPFK